MKKLLMAVAVVGLVGFATSCKKECKCSLAGVDFPVGSAGVDTKEKCTDFQDAYNDAGTIVENFVKLTCEWK